MPYQSVQITRKQPDDVSLFGSARRVMLNPLFNFCPVYAYINRRSPITGMLTPPAVEAYIFPNTFNGNWVACFIGGEFGWIDTNLINIEPMSGVGEEIPAPPNNPIEGDEEKPKKVKLSKSQVSQPEPSSVSPPSGK